MRPPEGLCLLQDPNLWLIYSIPLVLATVGAYVQFTTSAAEFGPIQQPTIHTFASTNVNRALIFSCSPVYTSF